MKVEHLALLKCLECGADIAISPHFPHSEAGIASDEIRTGVLTCTRCSALYPVLDGAGIFFKRNLYHFHLKEGELKDCAALGLASYFAQSEAIGKDEKSVVAVAKNWEYQWGEIYRVEGKNIASDPYLSEEKFFKFIPIEKQRYRGKTVIIWCGGNGREARHISAFGPSLLIIVEIGGEINLIRDVVENGTNLLLIRADMLNHPLKNGVADISICDHALHHLIDRETGFRQVVGGLKTQGLAAINVYSHENNFLMTHITEPLKVLLHRFPLRIQHCIAWVPAFIVWASIHFFYLPLSKIFPERICKKVFLFEHMMYWAPSGFHFIWTVCFDLIHAPIAYYFKREEVERLASGGGVAVEWLENVHGTTWSLVGVKR